MIGIYRFTNKKNGMVYIGQSKSIVARKAAMMCQLRHGRFENHHIQADYDRHGEKAFTHEVVCTCKASELDRLERALIADAEQKGKCYNRRQGGKRGVVRNLSNKPNYSYKSPLK